MATQNNNKNEIEIDLRGLLSAILNRLTIIILVGILVGGVAFAYTQYFVDPQYTSTTKVYIVTKQDPTEKSISSGDLALSTYLANDYQVLLKSQKVLEKVKSELQLEESVAQLSSMISIELEEDTRVIDINVVTTNAKKSKQIADKVRDVANQQTEEIMEYVKAVNPVDEATLPTAPSSPNVQKNTMLGFIIGFGIALLIVVIMFVLDDTIKTPDDIEKRLGVSVLASIPLKSERRKGYGYGYGNGYGYGYGYGHKKKKDEEEADDKKDDNKSTEGKE